MLNNGNGTFENGVYYYVPEGPEDITGAYFDLDSDIDLAVANNMSNDIGIIFIDGNPNFTTPIYYDVDLEPKKIISNNFDNYSDVDLVVANY